MININAFRFWWDLGYHDLLPIVPADAALTAKYADKEKQRGKMPGVKYRDGKWGPIKGWYNLKPTEADVETWNAMGASVGLRTGRAFLLDVDAYDEETGKLIEDKLVQRLGPAPMRVGQWPKRAFLYRTEQPFQIRIMKFTGFGGTPGQIEMPAQVVISGTHARTGKPYDWVRDPVPFDALTCVTKAQVEAVCAELADLLPGAAFDGSAHDADAVPPAQLRTPDVEMIKHMVAVTPNSYEKGSYDKWRDYGQALRGALPDDPDLACELFEQFTEKAGLYEPEEDPIRVFNSLGPSRTLGWEYLRDKAYEATGIRMDAILYTEREEPLFGDNPPAAQNLSKPFFTILTLDQIAQLPPPKFLIDRHVPEKSVGFLYGDPGTGKSFIALDWALHIAYGKPTWHGDPLIAPDGGMVVYLAGEGASGMRTRSQAWKKRHGYSHDSDRFGLLGGAVNFMSKDDGPRLLASLKHHAATFNRPISMIVVDTVSRSMPGADENSQKEMTLFVRACDLLRDEFGCAVVGVHHANKSGDMRGSTVLLGAGDFVLKLERKKGHQVGYLVCEKQKDAPDGWKDSYRFDVVSVGEKESSLVPMRLNSVDAETVPAGLEAAILGALDGAWKRGEPWGKAPQTKDRWAVKRMVNDFAMDAHDAELKMAEWLASGVVADDWIDKRDKKKGLKRVDFSEPAASEWADDETQQGAFD